MSTRKRRPHPSKRCFLICPTGAPDSSVRDRLEGMIDLVIRPVLLEHGVELIAAVELNQHGTLTEQIVQHLFEDDLVIADLTGLRPNVLWELGVREATGKLAIIICEQGTEIPSDLTYHHHLQYQFGLGAAMGAFKSNLSGYIANALANPDPQTLVARYSRGAGAESQPGCVDRLGYLMRTVSAIADSLGRDSDARAVEVMAHRDWGLNEPGWHSYELRVGGTASSFEQFRRILRKHSERSRMLRKTDASEGTPSHVMVSFQTPIAPSTLDSAALEAGLELVEPAKQLGHSR